MVFTVKIQTYLIVRVHFTQFAIYEIGANTSHLT